MTDTPATARTFSRADATAALGEALLGDPSAEPDHRLTTEQLMHHARARGLDEAQVLEAVLVARAQGLAGARATRARRWLVGLAGMGLGALAIHFMRGGTSGEDPAKDPAVDPQNLGAGYELTERGAGADPLPQDSTQQVPMRPGEAFELSLPEKADWLGVGGGGAWFALHYPTTNEMHVLDAHTLGLRCAVTLSPGLALYGASKEGVLRLTVDDNEVSMLSPQTCEVLRANKLAPDLVPKRLAVGSGATTDALVGGCEEANRRSRCYWLTLELSTLAASPTTFDASTSRPPRLDSQYPQVVRASSDGGVYTVRSAANPAGDSVSLVRGEHNVAVHRTRGQGGYRVPSADGTRIYGADGVYTQKQRRVLGYLPAASGLLPAQDGVGFLAIEGVRLHGNVAQRRTPLPTQRVARAYGVDDAETGVAFGVGELLSGNAPTVLEFPAFDGRIFWFGERQVLVTFPEGNDKLIVRGAPK